MSTELRLKELEDIARVRTIVHENGVSLNDSELKQLVDSIADYIELSDNVDLQKPVVVNCTQVNLGCNYEFTLMCSDGTTELFSFQGKEMQKRYYSARR